MSLIEITGHAAALDGLFAKAEAARLKAYGRYSGFLVGAAILDGDGITHIGCNVENAAFPIGTCAEAGAIAAMVLAGVTSFTDIAVVGGPADGNLIVCPPCGGCRQRIREFGGLQARVHMRGADGVVVTKTLDELLPLSFGPEHL
jgi:cytidine deaminase